MSFPAYEQIMTRVTAVLHSMSFDKSNSSPSFYVFSAFEVGSISTRGVMLKAISSNLITFS